MIKRIRDWLVDHHWLHDWMKWERYDIGVRSMNPWTGHAIDDGVQTRQRRSCKRCGHTQDKKICG